MPPPSLAKGPTTGDAGKVSTPRKSTLQTGPSVQEHSDKPKKSELKGDGRPRTATLKYATQAHIHRIRNATLQSDYKNLCKFSPSTSPTTKHSEIDELPAWSLHKDSQFATANDADEVESVDWSAPMDITSYLYKPEFILMANRARHKKQVTELSSVTTTLITANTNTDVSSNTTSFSVVSPTVLPGSSNNEEEEMKKEFVENYVKAASKRRNLKTNSRFARQRQEYNAFVKDVNNEIRDLSFETKRWDVYTPRSSKWKQDRRQDISKRGYTTLKNLYELNPELTESAAGKYICGPPGKHWMGMSRMEVMEVMAKIRKELGLPPKHYNDLPTSPPASKHLASSARKKKCGNSKKLRQKSSSSTTQKEKKPKSATPRINASQLPPQHVPGPKHLHTNICIRPWEAALDGWNQEEKNVDGIEKEEKMVDNPWSNSNSRSSTPFMPPWVKPATAATAGSIGSDTVKLDETEEAGEKTEEKVEDDNEDYITLEIFNPVFRIQR